MQMQTLQFLNMTSYHQIFKNCFFFFKYSAKIYSVLKVGLFLQFSTNILFLISLYRHFFRGIFLEAIAFKAMIVIL